MSTMEQLRRDLHEEIQALPESLLEEVKLLIDFLRIREAADQGGYPITVDLAMQQLDSVDITHEQEELADYRQLHPHDD